MRQVFAAAAVAAVALGGRHFYRYLNSKRKNRLHQHKLEVWEGEGGAVPVASDRTAAQIAPQSAAPASPRADS
jgi:hypothetical protein